MRTRGRRRRSRTDASPPVSAALAPAGDLDPTFGSSGQVMTAMGSGRSYAHAVAIQHDGKIVAAGQAQVGRGNNFDFGLTRHNSNGALDASFGSGGKITTYFGSGRAAANAVAIQSDGQIVAAGNARADGLSHFALAGFSAVQQGDAATEGGRLSGWLTVLASVLAILITTGVGRQRSLHRR